MASVQVPYWELLGNLRTSLPDNIRGLLSALRFPGSPKRQAHGRSRGRVAEKDLNVPDPSQSLSFPGDAGTESTSDPLGGGLITHRCRGSVVAFSISKSADPNEELKVG